MVWPVFLDFGEKFKYMGKNIFKLFRMPLQHIGEKSESIRSDALDNVPHYKGLCYIGSGGWSI